MKVSTRSGRTWLVTPFVLGFVLVTTLAAGLFSPKTAHAASTFTNPISSLADPFITYDHGFYYLTGTSTGTSIEIQSGALLESMSQNSTTIWSPSGDQPQYQVWSPSMFRLLYQGEPHWFVYFTAAPTNDNASHRIYVLMSSGNDPLGPYTFQGRLAGSDNTTTIDPSILQIKNQLYLLEVEEPGVQHVGEPGANVTYIAPLSDPLTQSGPSQSLIYPDQSWERGGGSGQSTYPVAEGPEALYHNGRTFIVYSGSDTSDSTYCLGLLTYNGGDPLDFHSWSKSGPVFQASADSGVYGPGRASFTTSPDGTESWMVYAAKTSSNYTTDGRTTRAQIFDWNADGTPNFGIPVELDVPFDTPSGELVGGNICEAISNQNSGDALDVQQASTNSGAFVVQWPYNGGFTQQWTFEQGPNGSYYIKNTNDGLYLDVYNAWTTAGATIDQWPFNGNANQEWNLLPGPNGSVYIQSVDSGFYLDVYNASTTADASIVLSPFNGNASQQWNFASEC